jgi:hypothetical protein
MLIVLYLTGKNHDLRNFLFVLFLFFYRLKGDLMIKIILLRFLKYFSSVFKQKQYWKLGFLYKQIET